MLMHCPVGGGLGWIKAGRSPGYNLAAQHIATAFRPDIGIDKVGGHLIPIRILLMDVDVDPANISGNSSTEYFIIDTHAHIYLRVLLNTVLGIVPEQESLFTDVPRFILGILELEPEMH
ncbi:hypothetical protein TWF225_002374 [Orbilia oligospora]|uniref:Uncharacterized protein n=1 Tax=Orbilia oligospora TaxID=2813651 RepID=A0A7C8P039_ORBOL|nr:hypothetical protein TWF751_003887 [Orbilia oligospora]KAF3162852.1 hypothetical protein TWF225_002374 [Orbilia oligospora]KAF3244789.1 hypothetical protein TWF217_010631 [Orbilia oligospora]KAF3260122.1 hypothetical protein TWF128_003600 [Orbilia oligospora]KAF3276418.1 hypothetical protein TWF132_002230 [Orbilia oligospora]